MPAPRRSNAHAQQRLLIALLLAILVAVFFWNSSTTSSVELDAPLLPSRSQPSQPSDSPQQPSSPVRLVLTDAGDDQRSSLADRSWIRLSGRFLDAATREPVAAVQVVTDTASTGTREEYRAHEDGTFRIEIQRPGRYRLSATHPRYEPFKLAYIRLSAVGSCDLGDLLLQPRVRRVIRVLDSASTPVDQVRTTVGPDKRPHQSSSGCRVVRYTGCRHRPPWGSGGLHE